MESNSRFFFVAHMFQRNLCAFEKIYAPYLSVSGSMATFQALSSVKKSRPRSTKTYMGVAIAIESFPGGQVSTQTLCLGVKQKAPKRSGFWWVKFGAQIFRPLEDSGNIL